MDKETFKARILRLAKDRPGLSFAEIERFIPECEGTKAIGPKNEFGEIFYWFGLNDEFLDALGDLVKAGDIEYDPTPALTYLIDGRVPNVPVMTRVPRKPFKKAKWLPVVINLKKK